jgi:hypothetical protein
MKRIFTLAALFFSLHAMSQNTGEKKPVKIFSSDRIINAYTPEMVAKGKMDFKVTHSFGDIAGKEGGHKRFFGLDGSTDIRIGFHIGITDRFNIGIARTKGDEQSLRKDTANSLAPSEFLARKNFEISLKYQLLRQMENDPSHPISVALFVNTAISSISANTLNPNTPSSFKNFGDRMSQVVQLIIAKKIGKISLQLNPTLVHYNFVPTYDKATTFALGGAARIPLSKKFAFIVDYFHPFHAKAKENNYYALKAVKFHDPLGLGLEIKTSGHIFHLNFTNTTGILENQFLPYNSSSWGKGQFRWGFSISRTFTLWREKKGK